MWKGGNFSADQSLRLSFVCVLSLNTGSFQSLIHKCRVDQPESPWKYRTGPKAQHVAKADLLVEGDTHDWSGDYSITRWKSNTKTQQNNSDMVILFLSESLCVCLCSDSLFYRLISGPCSGSLVSTSSACVLATSTTVPLVPSAISQAWNVGRTTEARLERRQIALYPLTCQRRRQMNSPSIINGIKEHLHWQWVAQSSSANLRKIKTVASVSSTAWEGFVVRLTPMVR